MATGTLEAPPAGTGEIPAGGPSAEDLAGDGWYEADDPTADGPAPAAPAPDEPSGEAPYGYTRDPETGALRPKLRPGRPRKPPAGDELAAGPKLAPPPDTPPPPRSRRSRKTQSPPGEPPAAPSPAAGDEPAMPRGGVIAAGVNKLYRRAGKLLRAFDGDIGQALIDCTRPEPPEDGEEPELSVGEAWENLCQANPRIRRMVLKWIAGGLYSDLVMAHLPLGIAVISKPLILKLIPFGRLIESWLEPDEDTTDDDLRPEDAAAMGALHHGTAARAAQKAAERMAARIDLDDLDPDLMAAAERVASRMPASGVPPGLRRAQPKHTSRARRRKGH